ncbi:hypothetical protein [Novosphingobium decolorationis]|uniref:Uncharacterized protein n=1 Tax=Novosphingobium decolorationis TaxID=2698673 RepID=A0ABX8E8A8_9SPHN|nr:hypothetical protein [Novosphingobium decolorationis]QVM85180.1 hypothetical protein HT578_17085 [Novosphingobium decolorationis]
MLKHEMARPVPQWLSELDPAAIPYTDFPLEKILENSLYYPACGFDGRPVQFLGGFVHGFIYVDYLVENQSVVDRASSSESGFSGYRLIGSKELKVSDLAPQGWAPRVPLQFRQDLQKFQSIQRRWTMPEAFATWYVFERASGLSDEHGPMRFSLLHICGDGVTTYQALYHTAGCAPEVLAIIQPGTGFGGNYTDFRDPTGFFAWTVLHNPAGATPEYLVCGGRLVDYTEAFWPDHYPDHVEWFQRVYGNGVWRRKAM